MKNKKGFTLIELITIIILLSIIALISTPIVLNVVDKSQEKARIQSIIGYADAVKLSYTEKLLNNIETPLSELANSKAQGSVVTCESVEYDEEKYGTLLHTCDVDTKGSYCYFNGTVYSNDSEECNNVYTIIENGVPSYNTPNVTILSQTPNETEYAQSKEIKIDFPSLKIVEEHYYIKVSKPVEVNDVVIAGCDILEYPSNCTSSSVTNLEENTWYEVSGEVIFTTTTNLTIEAVIGNNGEYSEKAIYEEKKIDTSAPSVDISSISAKTDRITVTANCSDTESGITKYEFSKDNGSTWISNGTTAAYTFIELDQTTSYTFIVRCTNGSGLTNTANATENTATIQNPTIAQYSQTPSSGTYATERVIRITFNNTNIENPSYYYSLDNSTWTQVESTTYDVTFTSDGYLYAKTVDENGNTATSATYTVTNMDTEVPTISASVSGKVATFTLSDNIGVVGYGVNQSDSIQPTYKAVTQTTSTQVTYTASSAGTYYAWVKDVAGNVNKTTFTISASAFSYAATATTSTYAATASCDSGYSLSGSTCSKTYQSGTNYSCPSGGTLSGTTCTITGTYAASCSQYKCTLYKSCTVYSMTGYCTSSASGSTVYTSTCYSGTSTTISNLGSACSTNCRNACTINQSAGYYYACPNTYKTGRQSACGTETVYGSECNNANSKTCNTYSCPNGGSLSGTTCTTTSTYTATGTPTYSTTTKNPSYSCPSGGSLSGTTCTKTTYSCPNGGTLNGTTCNF